MAKTKNRGAGPKENRLEAALEAFRRGDYLSARPGFDAVAANPEASGAERSSAADLGAATRVDRATLLTGLACLGLYVVAMAITSVIQP